MRGRRNLATPLFSAPHNLGTPVAATPARTNAKPATARRTRICAGSNAAAARITSPLRTREPNLGSCVRSLQARTDHPAPGKLR